MESRHPPSPFPPRLIPYVMTKPSYVHSRSRPIPAVPALSHFLASVLFRTSLTSLLSPPRHTAYPSHPYLPPSPFHLPRHPSRSIELSIHYSICYLIVCAVWFVVYPTLSLVGHSGSWWKQKTAFGFLYISIVPGLLGIIFRCLEGPMVPDGR